MALTDLETIKRLLNIPMDVTVNDVWLDALREAAESNVKTYCKRDFESQIYTDYYSGSNTRYLVLRQRPVTAVTSVYLDHRGRFGQNPDGSYSSDTLLTNGIDYVLTYDQGTATSACGVLQRVNGVWPEIYREHWTNKVSGEPAPAIGNIKVTYTAGFTTIPMDLQYAVCWIVAFMRRNLPVGGILGSEKIGDYSYSLLNPRSAGLLPPELATARQILARYREPSFPA